MWALYIVLPLIVIAIAGSIALGGVFAIVFVPLVAIVAVFAGLSGRLGRLLLRPGDVLPDAGGGTPTTPDELVDARRRQQ